jgi:hypothetical protein
MVDTTTTTMNNPTQIETTESFDDFRGVICDLGFGDDVIYTAQVNQNICQINPVKYYIRSFPGKGRVGKNDQTALIFQRACDEWTKHTGVRFERVFAESESNFFIRCANKTQEYEEKHMVARSFFWSEKRVKTFIVWKQFKNWDAYIMFLHQIGHILGFRHEHGFGKHSIMSCKTMTLSDDDIVLCKKMYPNSYQ